MDERLMRAELERKRKELLSKLQHLENRKLQTTVNVHSHNSILGSTQTESIEGIGQNTAQKHRSIEPVSPLSRSRVANASRFPRHFASHSSEVNNEIDITKSRSRMPASPNRARKREVSQEDSDSVRYDSLNSDVRYPMPSFIDDEEHNLSQTDYIHRKGLQGALVKVLSTRENRSTGQIERDKAAVLRAPGTLGIDLSMNPRKSGRVRKYSPNATIPLLNVPLPIYDGRSGIYVLLDFASGIPAHISRFQIMVNLSIGADAFGDRIRLGPFFTTRGAPISDSTLLNRVEYTEGVVSSEPAVSSADSNSTKLTGISEISRKISLDGNLTSHTSLFLSFESLDTDGVAKIEGSAVIPLVLPLRMRGGINATPKQLLKEAIRMKDIFYETNLRKIFSEDPTVYNNAGESGAVLDALDEIPIHLRPLHPDRLDEVIYTPFCRAGAVKVNGVASDPADPFSLYFRLYSNSEYSVMLTHANELQPIIYEGERSENEELIENVDKSKKSQHRRRNNNLIRITNGINDPDESDPDEDAYRKAERIKTKGDPMNLYDKNYEGVEKSKRSSQHFVPEALTVPPTLQHLYSHLETSAGTPWQALPGDIAALAVQDDSEFISSIYGAPSMEPKHPNGIDELAAVPDPNLGEGWGPPDSGWSLIVESLHLPIQSNVLFGYVFNTKEGEALVRSTLLRTGRSDHLALSRGSGVNILKKKNILFSQPYSTDKKERTVFSFAYPFSDDTYSPESVQFSEKHAETTVDGPVLAIEALLPPPDNPLDLQQLRNSEFSLTFVPENSISKNTPAVAAKALYKSRQSGQVLQFSLDSVFHSILSIAMASASSRSIPRPWLASLVHFLEKRQHIDADIALQVALEVFPTLRNTSFSVTPNEVFWTIPIPVELNVPHPLDSTLNPRNEALRATAFVRLRAPVWGIARGILSLFSPQPALSVSIARRSATMWRRAVQAQIEDPRFIESSLQLKQRKDALSKVESDLGLIGTNSSILSNIVKRSIFSQKSPRETVRSLIMGGPIPRICKEISLPVGKTRVRSFDLNSGSFSISIDAARHLPPSTVFVRLTAVILSPSYKPYAAPAVFDCSPVGSLCSPHFGATLHIHIRQSAADRVWASRATRTDDESFQQLLKSEALKLDLNKEFSHNVFTTIKQRRGFSSEKKSRLSSKGDVENSSQDEYYDEIRQILKSTSDITSVARLLSEAYCRDLHLEVPSPMHPNSVLVVKLEAVNAISEYNLLGYSMFPLFSIVSEAPMSQIVLAHARANATPETNIKAIEKAQEASAKAETESELPAPSFPYITRQQPILTRESYLHDFRAIYRVPMAGTAARQFLDGLQRHQFTYSRVYDATTGTKKKKATPGGESLSVEFDILGSIADDEEDPVKINRMFPPFTLDTDKVPAPSKELIEIALNTGHFEIPIALCAPDLENPLIPLNNAHLPILPGSSLLIRMAPFVGSYDPTKGDSSASDVDENDDDSESQQRLIHRFEYSHEVDSVQPLYVDGIYQSYGVGMPAGLNNSIHVDKLISKYKMSQDAGKLTKNDEKLGLGDSGIYSFFQSELASIALSARFTDAGTPNNTFTALPTPFDLTDNATSTLLTEKSPYDLFQSVAFLDVSNEVSEGTGMFGSTDWVVGDSSRIVQEALDRGSTLDKVFAEMEFKNNSTHNNHNPPSSSSTHISSNNQEKTSRVMQDVLNNKKNHNIVNSLTTPVITDLQQRHPLLALISEAASLSGVSISQVFPNALQVVPLGSQVIPDFIPMSPFVPDGSIPRRFLNSLASSDEGRPVYWDTSILINNEKLDAYYQVVGFIFDRATQASLAEPVKTFEEQLEKDIEGVQIYRSDKKVDNETDASGSKVVVRRRKFLKSNILSILPPISHLISIPRGPHYPSLRSFLIHPFRTQISSDISRKAFIFSDLTRRRNLYSYYNQVCDELSHKYSVVASCTTALEVSVEFSIWSPGFTSTKPIGRVSFELCNCEYPLYSESNDPAAAVTPGSGDSKPSTGKDSTPEDVSLLVKNLKLPLEDSNFIIPPTNLSRAITAPLRVTLDTGNTDPATMLLAKVSIVPVDVYICDVLPLAPTDGFEPGGVKSKPTGFFASMKQKEVPPSTRDLVPLRKRIVKKFNHPPINLAYSFLPLFSGICVNPATKGMVGQSRRDVRESVKNGLRNCQMSPTYGIVNMPLFSGSPTLRQMNVYSVGYNSIMLGAAAAPGVLRLRNAAFSSRVPLSARTLPLFNVHSQLGFMNNSNSESGFNSNNFDASVFSVSDPHSQVMEGAVANQTIQNKTTNSDGSSGNSNVGLNVIPNVYSMLDTLESLYLQLLGLQRASTRVMAQFALKTYNLPPQSFENMNPPSGSGNGKERGVSTGWGGVDTKGHPMHAYDYAFKANPNLPPGTSVSEVTEKMVGKAIEMKLPTGRKNRPNVLYAMNNMGLASSGTGTAGPGGRMQQNLLQFNQSIDEQARMSTLAKNVNPINRESLKRCMTSSAANGASAGAVINQIISDKLRQLQGKPKYNISQYYGDTGDDDGKEKGEGDENGEESDDSVDLLDQKQSVLRKLMEKTAKMGNSQTQNQKKKKKKKKNYIPQPSERTNFNEELVEAPYLNSEALMRQKGAYPYEHSESEESSDGELPPLPPQKTPFLPVTNPLSIDTLIQFPQDNTLSVAVIPECLSPFLDLPNSSFVSHFVTDAYRFASPCAYNNTLGSPNLKASDSKDNKKVKGKAKKESKAIKEAEEFRTLLQRSSPLVMLPPDPGDPIREEEEFEDSYYKDIMKKYEKQGKVMGWEEEIAAFTSSRFFVGLQQVSDVLNTGVDLRTFLNELNDDEE